MKSRDALLTLIPEQLQTSLSKAGALYQAAHFHCVENFYGHNKYLFSISTKHHTFCQKLRGTQLVSNRYFKYREEFICKFDVRTHSTSFSVLDLVIDIID